MRTTRDESGGSPRTKDDAFALSKIAETFNEYDWVAAAKQIAASTSTELFDCAGDAADMIKDELQADNGNGNGARHYHVPSPQSQSPPQPQSSPTSVLRSPTMLSNDRYANRHQDQHQHRIRESDFSVESNDTQSINGETFGGISVLTTETADPITPSLAPSTGTTSVGTTTWDDLYVKNLPYKSVEVTFNSDEDEETPKLDEAPDGRKKKRGIILGAAIILAAILIAAAVAVPLMLKGQSRNNKAAEFNEGENVTGDSTGTPSRAPTFSPTIENSEQATSSGDDNIDGEGQSIFDAFSSSPSQPSLSVSRSPSALATRVPSSPAQSMGTVSPISENETASTSASPSISGEGLFWNQGPTNHPTIATPTIWEISTPTNPIPTATSAKPTTIPTLRSSSGNPTSPELTISPSLRPATKEPSSAPTTGQPASSAPVATGTVVVVVIPSPTSTSPIEATPEPTQSPTSLVPTVSTPEPSPSVTSLALTTKQPTPKPTPLPTTLAPTTKQPTRRPTPEPTTKQPTRRPTTEPTTMQPTRRPTPEPTTRQPTRRPTPEPTTRQPIRSPTAESTDFIELDFSQPATSRLTIELQTDQYSVETSWTLYSVNAVTDEQTTLVDGVEENTYESFEQDSIDLFLTPGTYRFTLKDSYGDGFCCSNGSDGWYLISLEGREIIRGTHYTSERSYDVVVGYDPDMNARDEEWLEAHNSRRKIWHERHGETYIPLLWSEGLAQDAFSWAQELLDDCDVNGITHESGVPDGENLAKNKATGEAGMGQLYPADSILRRWVDFEETWGYPRNAHLTQALWRGSRYLGCGDAVKNYNDGAICRIQVCRYVRAGNCGMGSYNASEGDNWLVPMLMDRTQCGPACPPEGCY